MTWCTIVIPRQILISFTDCRALTANETAEQAKYCLLVCEQLQQIAVFVITEKREQHQRSIDEHSCGRAVVGAAKGHEKKKKYAKNKVEPPLQMRRCFGVE